MTLFQTLALLFLTTTVLMEIRAVLRGQLGTAAFLARALVWVVAALAISRPDLVQSLANLLGIGRGADVILYAFALLFLLVSFYFYSRYIQLQRQVTALVRHLAIAEAQRGGHTIPTDDLSAAG